MLQSSVADLLKMKCNWANMGLKKAFPSIHVTQLLTKQWRSTRVYLQTFGSHSLQKPLPGPSFLLICINGYQFLQFANSLDIFLNFNLKHSVAEKRGRMKERPEYSSLYIVNRIEQNAWVEINACVEMGAGVCSVHEGWSGVLSNRNRAN